MTVNIAIDGPAGAGKSTIARMLAGKLNYIYVDTGAMYRAVALHFLRRGTDMDDPKAIEEALSGISVGLAYENGVQKVLLDGEDVSGLIRTPEVSSMASIAAAKPAVRAKLLNLQREIAARDNVVMDGRDIGTVVLPDAAVKIFLTASSHVRALRRFNELPDPKPPLSEIEKDIIERDHRDMTRKEAPLKQAADAVLVDSSDLTPEQVVLRIEEIANGR